MLDWRGQDRDRLWQAETACDRQRQSGTGRDRHGQEARGRNRYEQARIDMKGQAGSDGNRQGWRGQVVTGAGARGDRQEQPETSRKRQEQAQSDRDIHPSTDDSCPSWFIIFCFDFFFSCDCLNIKGEIYIDIRDTIPLRRRRGGGGGRPGTCHFRGILHWMYSYMLIAIFTHKINTI